MNKNYLGFALVILAGLYFVATALNKGSNDQSEKKVASNLPVVVVATEPPGAADLATRIMQKNGWDKDAEFQIEQRPVFSEAAVTTLVYGTVDLITIAPLTAVSLVNSKKPIVFLVNGGSVNCPFFVNPESEAKTWQDLKGKKVGTTTETGPSFTTFKVIMKAKENIDVDKYFQISHSTSKELIPRLTRKEVDGAIGRCSEIGIARALIEAKFKTIGNITDIAFRDNDFKELMVDGLVANREWTDKNPALAKKVQDLYYKTYDYIRLHPEVFDDPDIKKAYALEDAPAELINKIKELVPSTYTFVPWNDVANYEYKYLELAQKNGLLDVLPPKDELFFKVQ